MGEIDMAMVPQGTDTNPGQADKNTTTMVLGHRNYAHLYQSGLLQNRPGNTQQKCRMYLRVTYLLELCTALGNALKHRLWAKP